MWNALSCVSIAGSFKTIGLDCYLRDPWEKARQMSFDTPGKEGISLVFDCPKTRVRWHKHLRICNGAVFKFRFRMYIITAIVGFSRSDILLKTFQFEILPSLSPLLPFFSSVCCFDLFTRHFPFLHIIMS